MKDSFFAGVALVLHTFRLMLRDGPDRFGYKLFHRQLWDEPIRSMIAGHVEVARVMGRPQTRALMRHHPRLLNVYFGGYLAKSFSKKMRRAILKEHYTYLANRVGETFFDELVGNKPKLWHTTIDDQHYAVTLAFNRRHHTEGDLMLAFEENSVQLYVISFTIAPGTLVDSSATHAMLIARVQGAPGQFDVIRRASRTFGGIPLPHLLVAAAHGVAGALNIKVIAAVKHSEQLMTSTDLRVFFDYDAFWQSFLGTETDKFYLIPVRLPELPAEQIHSRRTRMKRRARYEISASAKSYLLENVLKRDPNA
jgi:uncharacterized protein VirK/YbjX